MTLLDIAIASSRLRRIEKFTIMVNIITGNTFADNRFVSAAISRSFYSRLSGFNEVSAYLPEVELLGTCSVLSKEDSLISSDFLFDSLVTSGTKEDLM